MSEIPWPYRLLALTALGVALIGFGWIKGASHVQARWDAAIQQQALPDFVREVFAVDGRQLLTQRGDEIGAHGHYSESMERVKDGLPESTVRAAANCCCKAGGQFVKRDSETDNLMSR